eukprot:EG_transcript_42005
MQWPTKQGCPQRGGHGVSRGLGRSASTAERKMRCCGCHCGGKRHGWDGLGVRHARDFFGIVGGHWGCRGICSEAAGRQALQRPRCLSGLNREMRGQNFCCVNACERMELCLRICQRKGEFK